MPTTRKPPAAPEVPTPWYRVPFVWFAITVMAAIVAACAHFVVLSLGVDHTPVPGEHERVFRVPVAPATAAPADTGADRRP